MPPFVPTPPPWIVWSPARVRYTLMNLDALHKLCRENGLHSTNMQVLVGHKPGNTTGTQGGKAHEAGWVCWTPLDVKWLKNPSTGEIVPTCGPTRGKGGGELFLETIAATSNPPMPFASKEMFLKLLHGRAHKGKEVKDLFKWVVVPKRTDAGECWPQVVITVCPACPR